MSGKYKRPPLRKSTTVGFRLGGHQIEITLSHRPDDDPDFPGKVFEVFYNNYKEGGPFGSSLQVQCSLISTALQLGRTPEEMLDGTPGNLPFDPAGRVFLLGDDTEYPVGSVLSVPNLILRTIIWANEGYGELRFDAD